MDSRFLDRSGLNPPPSANSGGIPTSSIPATSTISSIPTSSASRPTQATPPGSANLVSGNSGSGPTTPTSQQPASNIPFLRQELHHHQHQHTHLHQHQHQHQALLPGGPSATSIFPPPLFKDIPKIGAVDSPFYRTTPIMGMPPYPYPSGILHPGLSGPTQFVPPSHLQSFVPKVRK